MPRDPTGLTSAASRESRKSLPVPVLRSEKTALARLSLAEDGRKKSTLLPPLDKEATFLRAPRKGASHTSFSDDFTETKRFKRVSVEMDRKIVTHLKRHLNKRIQKRFDGLGETWEYTSDGEAGPAVGTDGWRSQQKQERERTIFHNYSETGEKILNGGRGRRSSSQSPTKTSVTSNGRSCASLNEEHGENDVDSTASNAKSSQRQEDVNQTFSKPAPLPDIRRNSSQSTGPSTGGDASRRTSIKTVNGGGGGGGEVAKVLVTQMSQS
ncbi:uncharacterized protein LOC106013420, partial [Aplysia californica]|uniref:Uncharacterized protein LOC106013420 n=1 Tax=Aplysia californica TaxID=6500 RepID=A0ABM1ABL0_APLCA